jgi:hypothetical protein
MDESLNFFDPREKTAHRRNRRISADHSPVIMVTTVRATLPFLHDNSGMDWESWSGVRKDIDCKPDKTTNGSGMTPELPRPRQSESSNPPHPTNPRQNQCSSLFSSEHPNVDAVFRYYIPARY